MAGTAMTRAIRAFLCICGHDLERHARAPMDALSRGEAFGVCRDCDCECYRDAWVRASRANKYGAVVTVVEGIWFDSAKEARRWQELRLLEQAGEIRGLERQPEYSLDISGGKVGVYRGDFRYLERTAEGGWGSVVVEDVKGIKTPVYRLKKRLLKALYAIDVRET